MRRSHVSPKLEASMSTVERIVGAAKPSGVHVEKTPGDRDIFVGIGGPKKVYQIDRNKVTKEERLQFRQKFEDYKNRKLEEELKMNNKCHHDDREEEVGENHNDDGDLKNEEIVATLQFPIQKPTGHPP